MKTNIYLIPFIITLIGFSFILLINYYFITEHLKVYTLKHVYDELDSGICIFFDDNESYNIIGSYYDFHNISDVQLEIKGKAFLTNQYNNKLKYSDINKLKRSKALNIINYFPAFKMNGLVTKYKDNVYKKIKDYSNYIQTNTLQAIFCKIDKLTNPHRVILESDLQFYISNIKFITNIFSNLMFIFLFFFLLQLCIYLTNTKDLYCRLILLLSFLSTIISITSYYIQNYLIKNY